jgi:hypothetical protein
MEFLPEQRRFSEYKKGEDLEAFEKRRLRWELENWRMIASRINFLLDRVNVTLEQSEDGTRYMKVEFILPGNTRNDDNNWRFLLKSKDEDSDGVDEVFDVELQMHRSGSWVTSDIWHG